MVLLLWIHGYRHDFTTDEGFDLVVRVDAGDNKHGTGVRTEQITISSSVLGRSVVLALEQAGYAVADYNAPERGMNVEEV